MRTKRPSPSASISLVILSVSTRVSTVPLAKGSFSATIHSAMVPSLISMPHLGMVNAFRFATARSSPEREDLAHRVLDLRGRRHPGALQIAGERDRRMGAGHHGGRRFQAGEGLGGENRRDVGRKADRKSVGEGKGGAGR